MPQPVPAADDAVLQRRGFLRGGALLAAAAGGAVAASAATVLPAAADDSGLVAVAVGIGPERLLDTRTSDGRSLIVASSSSALDAKNRLKKNAWIDVEVFPADQDITLISAFVNLTSVGSTKAGSLVVTQPGEDKPSGSTLTYGKAKTVSNGAIVGVGLSDDGATFTVRVYASSPTHVTLDLTGVSAFFSAETEEPAAVRAAAARANVTRITKAARLIKR